jgi:exonuclease III
MDFFSEKDFDNELVYPFVQKMAKEIGLQERFTQREKVRIFELVEGDVSVAKIDFAHYPFRRLQKGEDFQGVEIDSFADIAINKLLSVNQRRDVKDFVDLYFILHLKPLKYSVWDLMEGVEKKFGFELDPIMVAADFLKVEEFDFLPKMIRPLDVGELQEFFKDKAREISRRFVE